jgi:hypothetical protein
MATLSANDAIDNNANLGNTRVYCYRSQSLISPDQQYAAYSRIQLQVETEFYQSQVNSVLFIENLRTGDLQTIIPTSPLANNPFANPMAERSGIISIAIPVSWSNSGDRLLAREFESIFGSDIASDYAVLVNRSLNRVSTIAPTQIHYTNAVLLGWSQAHPDRVMFEAGIIGESEWQRWTVDVSGQTQRAERDDHPIVYGQVSTSIWTGPQEIKIAS